MKKTILMVLSLLVIGLFLVSCTSTDGSDANFAGEVYKVQKNIPSIQKTEFKPMAIEVTDQANSQPLSGVKVALYSGSDLLAEGFTNTNGVFNTLGELCHVYTLILNKSGYTENTTIVKYPCSKDELKVSVVMNQSGQVVSSTNLGAKAGGQCKVLWEHVQDGKLVCSKISKAGGVYRYLSNNDGDKLFNYFNEVEQNSVSDNTLALITKYPLGIAGKYCVNDSGCVKGLSCYILWGPNSKGVCLDTASIYSTSDNVDYETNFLLSTENKQYIAGQVCKLLPYNAPDSYWVINNPSTNFPEDTCKKGTVISVGLENKTSTKFTFECLYSVAITTKPYCLVAGFEYDIKTNVLKYQYGGDKGYFCCGISATACAESCETKGEVCFMGMHAYLNNCDPDAKVTNPDSYTYYALQEINSKKPYWYYWENWKNSK